VCRGVLLFGATLVYSALRWCGMLSPPSPLPAQLLLLPCMPKPVGEALCGAGGNLSALGSPHLAGLPEVSGWAPMKG